MKKRVFVFVIGPLAYVLSAHTDSEAVWVKDVTPFQRGKRVSNDRDLPDQLRFQLRRGSNILTLNLKRNHMIDPNADVYFVTKLKDGRSILEKTPDLPNIDMAYCQDRDTEASIAVRCVKRSSKRCERVINGKIRMSDVSYDLRHLETSVESRNLFETPYSLGRPYVLQHHAKFQRDISVEDEDAANNEKNGKQGMTDLLQRLLHSQDAKLLYRNVTGRETAGKRNSPRGIYNVSVVFLVDSGIWDLFSSLQEITENANQDKVTKEIRKYFSHIINGVNLTYQAIEDTSISLNIYLRDFVIFKRETDFPHNYSKVIKRKGRSMVEVYDYLDDLHDWDVNTGSVELPPYDHAMLFTRYDLYEETTNNTDVTGNSATGGICEKGERISLVRQGDYFQTVTTAAHELGHNLGASHDGEGDSIACNTSDFFIMSANRIKFDPDKTYSRHPWIFSNCSVEAFKKTLKNRDCANNKGVVYNETEWMMYIKHMPGEVYTYDRQCELIRGRNSVIFGTVSEQSCRFMECTNSKTGRSNKTYFSAARGTRCGYKKVISLSRKFVVHRREV